MCIHTFVKRTNRTAKKEHYKRSIMLEPTRTSLVLFLVALLNVSQAFVAPSSLLLTAQQQVTLLPRAPVSIFAANDDEGALSTPRRRRKRKVAQEEEEEEETTASAVPPRLRQDAPVALAVTDVRNLVGGGSAPPAATTQASSSSWSSSLIQPKATATQAASSTPTSSVTSFASSSSSASSTSTDDSLARLLQDAKEMSDNNISDDAIGSNKQSSSNDLSIPRMISSVISTIVTVDFFVVCGFLLWFLAGIFSSYVLQNDDLQIAFNSNFERLVQPALGILMIGALAGNFFKEDDEEVQEV